MVTATDKQLLEKYLSGSEEAFTEIIDRHAVMVRSVCQRVLQNASDCDDAFQATFFILASRAKTIAWQDSIAGWLHQVARRVAVRLRSNLARRRIVEKEAYRDEQDSASDPLHNVGIRELGEILDKEIGLLPDRFREVIVLTQAEGLSRSEAASRLGISVAAVKDRIERGRELLQKRLLKHGLTLTSVTLAAWLLPGSAHASGLQSLISCTSQLAASFTAGKLVGAQLSASGTLAQGFLKYMGFQKASVLLAILLSLITGGSIAYGFIQDNPTRFTEGLRGRLVRLSTNQRPSLTIELDEYHTLLDLDISNKAQVWIAYESTQLDKLKIGQTLSVRLDSDHRTIKEIHAQGAVREATIKEVADLGRITVAADDDAPESKTQSIELSPDAIVRVGGMPATREDLKPGMSVPLEYGESGVVVHAIEIEVDDAQVMEGELVGIDLVKRQIILATEGEDDLVVHKILRIDSSALLSSHGESIQLEELKPGCMLRIRVDETGKSVRALIAEVPGQN